MCIAESFIRDKKISEICLNPQPMNVNRNRGKRGEGVLKPMVFVKSAPKYQTEPTIKGYIRDTGSMIYGNVYIH